MHNHAGYFLTKIFHPNVQFDSGELCLDILKKEWTPAWTLQSVCRAVVALLSQRVAYWDGCEVAGLALL